MVCAFVFEQLLHQKCKTPNMFSDHFPAMVAICELCVIPCRFPTPLFRAHPLRALSAVLSWFWNPPLMTLPEHWSGCKGQSGSLWVVWEPKVGCV